MLLQKPNLSVVVPVYGCRDTLQDLVEQVFKLEPEIGPIELIFVDDASIDGRVFRLAAGTGVCGAGGHPGGRAGR